jgi:hypothetical protein
MTHNPALWLYNNVQSWLVRETKKKGKRKRVLYLLPLLHLEMFAWLRKLTGYSHFASKMNIRSCYLLPLAVLVERPIANGLIDDDIAVTDFDVVKTRRVGANPCLVLDGSSLATEIRKRNQITFTTLATPRKCILHEIASFLLTRDSIRLSDQTMLTSFGEK